MFAFIQQYRPKLIIFLCLISFLGGCNASTSEHLKSYMTKTLILPSGAQMKVYIAESVEKQKLGLSGIKSKDFKANEAMLFPWTKMKMRQFWMPNTHFDLDVVFMNGENYILEIHRGLKHFPKDGPKNKIPLSKEVYSQNILEVRSDSALAKQLKPGMILNFQ